ncbi:hypothetical protein ACH347_29860 [Saccharopolyspora sp. 5N102]|uniref:hypothetical protein n=1 Tax=Saccharopolyspora sp. 5N102 TaxID=3375155 RepID=UPI0037B0EA62
MTGHNVIMSPGARGPITNDELASAPVTGTLYVPRNTSMQVNSFRHMTAHRPT